MFGSDFKSFINSSQGPQKTEIDSLIEGINQHKDEESKQLYTILNYLKYGSQKILPSKKDSILIFGNTGSGKTSLFAFLCSLDLVVNVVDYDAVLQYKNPSHKEYGMIGSSFIESQTFIPNKFSFENVDIWDCPGFQDSRGDIIDVVNSYFMHKIITGSQGIKLIFLLDGQIFEQNGFEQKGKSLKQIFEVIYQLTKNSKIDFGANIMFIFSKTSNPLQFYQQKLHYFLDQIVQSPNYTNQLKEKFNFHDYKQFYNKLKQVTVDTFPLADEDMEGKEYGTKQQRECLNSKINKLKYYYQNDLDIPFAISSQGQIKIIQRYSFNQVCDTFTALCYNISSSIKSFDEKQTMQADNILQHYKMNQDPSNLQTNLDVFKFIKSQLIIPLINTISLQSQSSNRIQENLTLTSQKQIEIIEFFLSEVYDSILNNLNLSIKLNTQLQFGKSETEYGFFMLKNTLENQKKIITQNKILMEMQKQQNDQEMLILSLEYQINQQEKNIDEKTSQLNQVINQIEQSEQKIIEAQQFYNEQQKQIQIIQQEINDKKILIEQSIQQLDQINKHFQSCQQQMDTLCQEIKKQNILLDKERQRSKDLQLQKTQLELNYQYEMQKQQQKNKQQDGFLGLFLNIVSTVMQIPATKKLEIPKI
ncbi:hypothetical protein TTHERM_000257099 (macronuclear) [Tetrahymena thermophila SB210]|uniref:50S ribosome-binding GTPase n=1 Tax=Tetrahymena thermophila (strain SB210) TaxID=312017 RepID=W7X8G2_TETTS|nr:hypothetical protein TTHERM_000257099 [Tetrahymena thermophila SB210]EWS73637.1 hypothetical protein TTHERM_000257099 [Tetrahymena thermophila SB210]|eukprot:XP_012653867.1 hypothetical protein TTHERM_000257099 [Tetrahymena thermophila SB210]